MTTPPIRIPDLTPKWRLACFAIFTLFAGILFHDSLARLFRFSLGDRSETHVLFVPFVSGCLVWSHRRSLLSRLSRGSPYGLLLLAPGLIIGFSGPELLPSLTEQSRLSVEILSLVLLCAGGVVLFLGTPVAREAAFPLAFLAYMIPFPEPVADALIVSLQKGTTCVCDLLLRGLGVPAVRDGCVFVFRDDFSIEIARECSGIRSAIVLVIVATLLGHFALRRNGSRVLLALVAIPIAVSKNALRVVVLSVIAAYFDESFMTSSLHSRGGYPFFVVALLGLGLVLKLLRRMEARRHRSREEPESPSAPPTR